MPSNGQSDLSPPEKSGRTPKQEPEKHRGRKNENRGKKSIASEKEDNTKEKPEEEL